MLLIVSYALAKHCSLLCAVILSKVCNELEIFIVIFWRIWTVFVEPSRCVMGSVGIKPGCTSEKQSESNGSNHCRLARSSSWRQRSLIIAGNLLLICSFFAGTCYLPCTVVSVVSPTIVYLLLSEQCFLFSFSLFSVLVIPRHIGPRTDNDMPLHLLGIFRMANVYFFIIPILTFDVDQHWTKSILLLIFTFSQAVFIGTCQDTSFSGL